MAAESRGIPPVFGPVWGVSGLLLAVSDALTARLGAVVVRGELSGVSRAASGHLYFTLKDADGAAAQMRCAMFRRGAALLGFQPADGQQVELRGRVAVYEARGELQLVAESLQRVGEGALYEEFLRRKQRLQAEGWFDAQRKRPIAARPRVVGVVTSLAAAALRDVLAALARRAPQVQVLIYPCLVQGAEAPAAIVEALAAAARHGRARTLLLVRGGGSLEDLWAFNDERVVEAVAASPLPVVAGIGHETDTTLAELAADLRAPTPTAAAELCAVARADDAAALAAGAQRMQLALFTRLEANAQRLDELARRLARPSAVVMVQRERLAQWEGRLQRALASTLHERRHRLERVEAVLRELDPRAVLGRGFAWLSDAAGLPVQSATQLQAGARFKALLADGELNAQVLS
jgi:exodeoxyribonuclease VII large subunit